MTRPSPQTERVVSIVRLLTDQADRGATLSELAAALGQTPATLVPVLSTLAAGGFVVRRPSDRRYHLGPALIEPGRVAAGRFPHLDATRQVVTDLARDTGYPVFAFQRDHDHARLVEAALVLARPAPWMAVGDVLPIEPPLGSVFVTWSGVEVMDRWLDRGRPSDATRAALVRRMALARELGFVVELRPPGPLAPRLTHLVQRGQQARRAEGIPRSVGGVEDFLPETVDRRTTYEVSTLSGPVRRPGTDGDEVDLALVLVGFDRPLTGEELRRLGGLVQGAAALLVSEPR